MTENFKALDKYFEKLDEKILKIEELSNKIEDGNGSNLGYRIANVLSCIVSAMGEMNLMIQKSNERTDAIVNNNKLTDTYNAS